MPTPVKIAVLGAEGRMGRTVLKEIGKLEDVKLVAALSAPNSGQLGKPFENITLTSDVRAALNLCDVLIDFSQPKAAIDAALMMHGTACKAFVTGTTGYTATEEKALEAAGENITLVKSGNFSIGIAVLESLAAQAANTLGDEWEIKIHDRHHKHKKDAPSGTALMLGKAAGDSVKYSAERNGETIGEHTVSFISDMETLTLSHTATDRALFAKGALRAALWAVTQDKGLYTMRDVLGL